MALGIVAASIGCTGSAMADPAAAEALFREGHQLLAQGRYAEAAAKLAESQAQDPASGTLINLALAYERQGRLATAWATYKQAAILARRDGRADRVASAERKTAELEPRVPALTFHAEHVAPGLVISWGNVKVGAGALDSAIPIDPGQYRILAEAPGRENWETTIAVLEAEQRVVDIPELNLSEASVVAKPLPPIQQKPPLQLAKPAPSHGAVAHRSPHRTLAWTLGTSGLVGIGIGAVFGVRALNRYSDAEHSCPSHTGCGSDAIDAWRSARTSAWIANVGIGLGAIAGAAGAWLLLGDGGDDARAVAFEVAPLGSGAGLAVRSRL